MSNAGTSSNDRDKRGSTHDELQRRDALTDDEINAAAMCDPDNPPLTDAQLARFRPLAPVKRIRHKLGMARNAFADAYGVPLDTLISWERHEAEPTPAEAAYLRLIEREPERAKLSAAMPAK